MRKKLPENFHREVLVFWEELIKNVRSNINSVTALNIEDEIKRSVTIITRQFGAIPNEIELERLCRHVLDKLRNKLEHGVLNPDLSEAISSETKKIIESLKKFRKVAAIAIITEASRAHRPN
jgi:hypothetical protein